MPALRMIASGLDEIAFTGSLAISKTSQPIEIEWNKQDDMQKNMSFEDKLNQFLKDSNEKMDQLKTRDSRKNNGMKSRRSSSIDF